MAEAVFRDLVKNAGASDEFHIDSAGTGSWHLGSPPHPETQTELRRNNIEVGGQRARQVTIDDFGDFDYIVAMDSDNASDLRKIESRAQKSDIDCVANISLLLEHAPRLGVRDVPDPYYAGGYDRVYELVSQASAQLLEFICEQESLQLSS